MMKKQLAGIALLLIGIFLVISYGLFYEWVALIGTVVGLTGLFIIIANAGKVEDT